jgi:DNA adenine methylase
LAVILVLKSNWVIIKMVAYQGGKVRLGKRIHDVIRKIEDVFFNDSIKRPYFEPFVGMGGVMKHFGKENNRCLLACDANIDIIMMWQALQNDWSPPEECSLEQFETYKNSDEHSADRGFIGCVASWGGIWFHAYRLKYITTKDYMGNGKRSIAEMKPYMANVRFLDARSYDIFSPKGQVIYADPPYIGNTLGNSKSLFRTFDHVKFWDKMREWSESNLVFISEWKAPDDFVEIWSAESTVTNKTNRKTKRYTDKLFVYEKIYDKIKFNLTKKWN